MGDDYALTSISVSTGDLVIIACASIRGVDPPVFTGAGGTFTLLDSEQANWGDENSYCDVFYRIATSSSSIEGDFGDGLATAWAVLVVPTGDFNASAPFVTAATVTDRTTSDTLALDQPARDASTNCRVAAWCADNGDPPTGNGTELEVSDQIFNQWLRVAYTASDTDLSTTGTGSAGLAGVAFEIASAEEGDEAEVARAESGTLSDARDRSVAGTIARAESGTLAAAQTASAALNAARSESATATAEHARTVGVGGTSPATGEVTDAGDRSVAGAVASEQSGTLADANTITGAVAVARAESGTLAAEHAQTTDDGSPTTPDVDDDDSATLGADHAATVALTVDRTETAQGTAAHAVELSDTTPDVGDTDGATMAASGTAVAALTRGNTASLLASSVFFVSVTLPNLTEVGVRFRRATPELRAGRRTPELDFTRAGPLLTFRRPRRAW